MYTQFCPKCGGDMELRRIVYTTGSTRYIYKCTRCGYTMEVEYKYNTNRTSYVDMNEWDL